MATVLKSIWPLMTGVFLLMLGNGLQGTLLGVRGALEGMSAASLSVVMSAYFAGLLAGARLAPRLIGRVGHVRVFAAFASLISAGFILYAMLPNPWVWTATRFLVGFCFCGVYVVSESWLNDIADNKTRGSIMSTYMLVQTVGIIAAQGLLNLADPSGYVLFALISVIISVSMTPMLLSGGAVPHFATAKPMTLRRLYDSSPLGLVTAFLMGGVFSALFGMTGVFGVEAGLSVARISILMIAIYVGGLVLQVPVGWLADRLERRTLIVAMAGLGVLGALGAFAAPDFWSMTICAAAIGGAANPIYALAVAHTNDHLERDDMAAASGGILFIHGIGAVSGPIVVGWIMDAGGARGFFAFLAALMAVIGAYALYRKTQRPALTPEETGDYEAVSPALQTVALEWEEEPEAAPVEADPGDSVEKPAAEEIYS